MSWKCLECGRKFKTVKAAARAANNGCPKCGGVDIDLAPPYNTSMPQIVSQDLRALTPPSRCAGRSPYHHGADETCPDCRKPLQPSVADGGWKPGDFDDRDMTPQTPPEVIEADARRIDESDAPDLGGKS